MERWISSESVIAIATILLVIVTAIYVYYAKKQSESTEQGIHLTRDSTRVEQRAWVGIDDYNIQARESSEAQWQSREPKKGEQFRVLIFIRNSGKVPALNVRASSAEMTLNVTQGY